MLELERNGQEEQGQPLFWKIEEAARQTGLSTNWFYSKSAAGRGFPGLVRIGRFLRVEREVFLEAVRKGLLAKQK